MYIELHCHSAFSFLDGASLPEQLALTASQLGYAALAARHAGLIVLSGCRNGLLPGVLRRDGLAAARRFAERCRAVFGKENFVIELQRNYVRGDLALTRALKALADDVHLSVVATGNVHYHARERHRLHDVLVAIRHRTTLDGSHDVRHANSEFFLRPPQEVETLFRDCPDAVANTLVLAERCREFDLTRDLGYRFPDFHGAERAPAPRALAELCRARLEERYPAGSPHRGEAERRLAEELGLVCSFPTYRLRSTVREIGKALDLPPGGIEQVAKLADRRSGGLADELDQLPGFAGRRSAPLWKELCELAEEIAGLPRHISQHVGGMVISSRPLVEIVPLERAAMEDRVVCQWDKDSCDDARFIKIDFLALGMLSLVEECVERIAVREGTPPDLSRIDFEDPAVYDRICRGDTVGLFQIESRAQIQMIRRTRPTNLEDLAVEVAIVRPGPIVGGAVNPYVRRREDQRRARAAGRPYEPPLEHPLVKEALAETLGVILYQDQVLHVCEAVAGFTAGIAA